MPVSVYMEWMQFLARDPYPDDKADWRAAMLAFTMASIWRGKKGRKSKFGDFMPEWSGRGQGSQKRAQRTPMDALRAMVNVAHLFGGKIEDNRPEKRKRRDGPIPVLG